MVALKKYSSIILLLILSIQTYAQDKLFLKNNTIIICKTLTLSKNSITYKDTSINSVTQTILKKDALMAELKTGEIYIFGSSNSFLMEGETSMNSTNSEDLENRIIEWEEKEKQFPNGILGFYPVQIFAGRFTVSYEKLTSNKTLGILFPVSLTYDMLANSTPSSSSSSTTTSTTAPEKKGVGIISGIDVNYYYTLKPALKYFFGPKVRYGTAMTLGGIEYLSFQMQNGLMKSRGSKFTHTFSVGFGFFKLSQKYANYPGYEANQVYPTGSLTWRLGFRL